MSDDSIELTPKAVEALEQQRVAFVEKFGREPGPDDPIFFDPDADTPQQIDEEKAARMMIAAFKRAGVPGNLIWAFEKTGLILTEDTYHKADKTDRYAWDAAIREWEGMNRQQRRRYLSSKP